MSEERWEAGKRLYDAHALVLGRGDEHDGLMHCQCETATAYRALDLTLEESWHASGVRSLRFRTYDSQRAELWGRCPEHHAPGIVDCTARDCHLDPNIYEIVWGLHDAGIATGWSCQGGGPPHGRSCRMVGGRGPEEDGLKAFETATRLGMPVYSWSLNRHHDDVTTWELRFGQEPWSRVAAGEATGQ